MTRPSERIREIISASITTKAFLLYDENFIKKIEQIADGLITTLKKGHKILIFGNGGSAADSQHFAAELVSRFQKERKALAAIALTANTSSLTAIANDYTFDIVFRRQLEALGKPGDCAFAISTSGKAKNVTAALQYAKKHKIKTVLLSGKDGGSCKQHADLAIVVPGETTARIQEAHILIIHIICELIEKAYAS
jgi:D-sedoheptulose 7-phosphate isomerase